MSSLKRHQNSNKSKSISGNEFEKEFTNLTGLKKVRKKDKPKFVNSHGLEQTIDFDFVYVSGDKKIYIDVSTTFRSDRLKQKSYNALIYKLTFPECKEVNFFMVVKTLTERGKTKKPILIEGIDKVMEIDEFLKIIN